MEQKTVTAKSAAHMAKLIEDAINRNRIPIVVADQPSIAAIVADLAADQLTVNRLLTDAAVRKHLQQAVAFKKQERRVGHILLMKTGKIGAGAFDGAHFVKIISNRLNVTIDSLANFLVGCE